MAGLFPGGVVVCQPDCLLADRQSQALQDEAAKGSMANRRPHDLVVSLTFGPVVALQGDLVDRCVVTKPILI